MLQWVQAIRACHIEQWKTACSHRELVMLACIESEPKSDFNKSHSSLSAVCEYLHFINDSYVDRLSQIGHLYGASCVPSSRHLPFFLSCTSHALRLSPGAVLRQGLGISLCSSHVTML